MLASPLSLTTSLITAPAPPSRLCTGPAADNGYGAGRGALPREAAAARGPALTLCFSPGLAAGMKPQKPGEPALASSPRLPKP